MSPRGKTVADAIELFEGLAKDLREHKDEFRDVVKDQQRFNLEITARVVDAEKADITINAKLDTIIDRLHNKRIGWQIWLPFSLTALISLISVVIQVLPKGGS